MLVVGSGSKKGRGKRKKKGQGERGLRRAGRRRTEKKTTRLAHLPKILTLSSFLVASKAHLN